MISSHTRCTSCRVHAIHGSFPVQDAFNAIVGIEADQRQAARARQNRWVAGGVAARRAVPIPELTTEWDVLARDAPAAALIALFPDLAVHFFDLLGSVGNIGYRDEPFVGAALRYWADHGEIRLRQAGRGPLRLEFDETAGNVKSIGPLDAPLVVAGTSFELLRSIVGRRSRRQVDALRWEGADGVARECFSVYGCRGDDLDE